LDKLEEQDVKAWEYVKKIPREDHCLASPNLRYGHDTSKSLAKVPCDKYRMRDDKAKQLRATPCGARDCTCLMWREYGSPCEHALACIKYEAENPFD
jgi:hypothetical protein